VEENTLSETKSSKEEVDRRKFLKYAGAAIVGAAVGGVGVAAYNASQAMPTQTVTQTVTPPPVTVTQTATATATASTPSLVGWSPRPDKPYAGTTLNVAAYQGWICYAGALKKIPDFEAATGINVNLIELPNPDILSKPLLDFSQGTKRYDVTTTSSGFWPAYFPYALNLNKYATEDFGSVDAFTSQLFPVIQKKPVYQGGLSAIPIHANMQFIVYRRDLMESATEQAAFKAKYGRDLGQPKSYDELVDLGTFFTRPETGMKGFTYWGKFPLGGYVYAALVWAERHIPFIDEKYNIDIDSGPGHDTAVRLAQWLVDLTKKYHITPDSESTVTSGAAWELYMAGKTPMLFGWMGDYWGTARTADVTAKFGQPAGWPWVVPGGWISCWGLVADSHTDNPGAAWEFMKWNASAGTQAAMADGSGQGSWFVSEAQDQVAKGYTAAGIPDGINAPGATWPAFIPEWAQIENGVIVVEADKLVSGQYTPEQLVDALVAGIKKAIEGHK
jgi:maltose-binding protein MalE